MNSKSADFAPVVLFVYKRLDTLRICIQALQANFLSEASELIIFSDAPKSERDLEAVSSVRDYLKTISGFKSVTIYESAANKGLAKSVIAGVSKVVQTYGQAIVLEDDLVTSDNFLTYMNEGLDFYKKDEKILSISGYTPSVEIPSEYDYDTFFGARSTSWGWATWADRWEKVNWDISSYKQDIPNLRRRLEFHRLGFNLYDMLKKQSQGKIDSWAIRWVFHQFKFDLLSVYPTISKVKNIGFGEEATHTNRDNNYNNIIDTSKIKALRFPPSDYRNKMIDSSFRRNYSFLTMLKNKIF